MPGLTEALRAPGLPGAFQSQGALQVPRDAAAPEPSRSPSPDGSASGGRAADAEGPQGSSPWQVPPRRAESRSLANRAFDVEAALLGHRSGRAPFVVVGILAAILLVLIAVLLVTG